MTRRLEHDWFPQELPVNVQIGSRSWCYSSYAFRHYRSLRPCGVRIGEDSGVYNGTFFDIGRHGQVEVGNFCTLVGAIIATNERITIGDYTFIAHEVVLADAAHAVPPAEDDADIRDVPAEPGVSIAIGENCWIATRVTLLRGARIGDGSVVGAGAVVDFDVPPHSVVAGNPAFLMGAAGRLRSRDADLTSAPEPD